LGSMVKGLCWNRKV